MAEDRRVARTRRSLQRALVELILEKGFDALSVAEICERADVGRTTFYAHYADKSDLLQGSLEGLGEHLREANRGPEDPSVHPALAFVRPMLEHAAEQADLFAALMRGRGGAFMQDLVHDIWCELIRERLSEPDELQVQAIAGGLGAAVEWWLTRAPDLAPAEVDARFRAAFEPGLAPQRAT